jgi:mRNA interferase MazF
LRRSEVWWADLAPPAGTRPVLLLSRDRAYAVRDFVTIAPISRTIRGIDSEVVLDASDGMRERCSVNLDDIQTVSKTRFRNYETTLSVAKMADVNAAIKFALGLE